MMTVNSLTSYIYAACISDSNITCRLLVLSLVNALNGQALRLCLLGLKDLRMGCSTDLVRTLLVSCLVEPS